MMCVCVCVQHQNFEEQMQGMKTQLIQLSTLLRLLDLAFWNYLGNGRPHRPGDCRSSRSPLTPTRFPPTESQDSGYLYFCFRWLLIRFKRELSFMDVLRLWEVSSPAAPRSGGGGVSFSASPPPPRLVLR